MKLTRIVGYFRKQLFPKTKLLILKFGYVSYVQKSSSNKFMHPSVNSIHR